MIVIENYLKCKYIYQNQLRWNIANHTCCDLFLQKYPISPQAPIQTLYAG